MKTIIIVVILTLVALCGYSFITTAVDNAAQESISNVDPQNTVTYSITGSVVKEGTYVLPSNATMLDLLTAAGGPTDNADPLAYNVTFALRPADKTYYIAPKVDITDTCNASDIVKCNINTADAETLHAVAGLSTSLSNAVVAYRSSVVFDAIEMIKDVSGIGPATFLTIRNKIQVRSAI